MRKVIMVIKNKSKMATSIIISKKFVPKFLLALFFSLNVANISAQEIKWDSTYKPEIYPSKVEMFYSFKHSKKDIVFLGNSITFWAEWSELLRNKHAKNRGIPGDITFGVLHRLDEVIIGKPAKVFILIGINDVAKNIPDTVILQNYKRMIDRLKAGSPRTKIYFQTMLPTNASFNKLTAHYNKEAHIIAINAGLKQLAEEEQITLIDTYAAFVDANGSLKKELTFDGVHLTKDGYYKWVALLKNGGYLK